MQKGKKSSYSGYVGSAFKAMAVSFFAAFFLGLIFHTNCPNDTYNQIAFLVFIIAPILCFISGLFLWKIKTKYTFLIFIGLGWFLGFLSAAILTFHPFGNYCPLPDTYCIAGPGFYCSVPYLHSGVLAVTIGQSTGTNWANANIISAVQGSTTGMGGGPIVISGNMLTGMAIASGQQVALSLPIGAAKVGTSLAGDIWACYVMTGTGTYNISTGTSSGYLTQIATLNTKAV